LSDSLLGGGFKGFLNEHYEIFPGNGTEFAL